MFRKIGFAAALLILPLLAAPAQAQPKEHRLVLQADTDDVGTLNIVLGNAMNAKKYYDAHGEKVTIEIVAYGPGITMLRSDTSPVKDHLDQARAAIPGLALSMCNNAKMTAEKREGHAIIPLPGVKVVAAGVVRIMELQEQGYSYVRP